jgi:hypothetical protein
VALAIGVAGSVLARRRFAVVYGRHCSPTCYPRRWSFCGRWMLATQFAELRIVMLVRSFSDRRYRVEELASAAAARNTVFRCERG